MDGPYTLKGHFEDGLHNMTSFFRQPIYFVMIWIGVTLNALLAVAVSFLDTEASLHLKNKKFLPQAWKKSFKAIKTRTVPNAAQRG